MDDFDFQNGFAPVNNTPDASPVNDTKSFDAEPIDSTKSTSTEYNDFQPMQPADTEPCVQQNPVQNTQPYEQNAPHAEQNPYSYTEPFSPAQNPQSVPPANPYSSAATPDSNAGQTANPYAQSPYNQNRPASPYGNPAYGANPPYNANQPYNSYPYYNAQQIKIPKKTKGFKIFIWSVCSIGVLLLVAFVVTIALWGTSQNGSGLNGGTVSTSSRPGLFNRNDDNSTDPNNSGVYVEQQPSIPVDEYSAQAAYKQLSSSVVTITCYEKSLTAAADSQAASEGTGIIVTDDGYVTTNSHVIGDSKTLYSVYVTLSTGEEYPATIVGFDSKTDLAVVKITADKDVKLKAALFADSEQVAVGQSVVAIGNPGGSNYSNSLTQGIISATNRTVSSSYVSYFQTDAAINPGNSGGPLANLYGQVIGVNTIKIVDEEYEGMGFAIPSNTVKSICDDLIKQGYVSNRVRIGITGKAIDSTTAAQYNVPTGILIISFSDDSPFKGTEVLEEDIITKFDGTEIESFSDLYVLLDKHKPGDKVTVTLYRSSTTGLGDGRTFEVEITLLADEGETQKTE